MKKGILGVIIALVVIAGLLVMPLIGSYNNLVTLSENADQQ